MLVKSWICYSFHSTPLHRTLSDGKRQTDRVSECLVPVFGFLLFFFLSHFQLQSSLHPLLQRRTSNEQGQHGGNESPERQQNGGDEPPGHQRDERDNSAPVSDSSVGDSSFNFLMDTEEGASGAEELDREASQTSLLQSEGNSSRTAAAAAVGGMQESTSGSGLPRSSKGTSLPQVEKRTFSPDGEERQRALEERKKVLLEKARRYV